MFKPLYFKTATRTFFSTESNLNYAREQSIFGRNSRRKTRKHLIARPVSVWYVISWRDYVFEPIELNLMLLYASSLFPEIALCRALS